MKILIKQSQLNIAIMRFIGLSLLILMSLIPELGKAQNKLNLDEDRIDEIFKKWDRPDSPGCALGIYHKGKIVYSNGYGQAILGEDRPITPKTIFYSGSISKQFTAAAIALLSLRGKIDLDKPVKYYIAEFLDNPNYPSITVEQLIHHTSGVPDIYALFRLYGIRLRDGVSGEKLFKIIAGQSHLNFEPGSAYLYSNSGYTTLAEIIERVTGQTLHEYTIENLFEPLRMNHTHFHDDHKHEIDNQALSYWGENNFRLGYIESFEGVGPGGLYTTVEDMLKWDQQLAHNKLPNAEFNRLMRKRGILNNGDTLTYAFGLKIEKYKGQKTIGHTGSFMGFKASYLRLPEYNYGTTILCNLGSTDPGELNKEIVDIVFKAPIKKWIPSYTGDYYSKALDLKFTITIRDNNLHLDREAGDSETMQYIDNQTFDAGRWEIEFLVTDQNEVEGFKLSSGRAKNIYFEKK